MKTIYLNRILKVNKKYIKYYKYIKMKMGESIKKVRIRKFIIFGIL